MVRINFKNLFLLTGLILFLLLFLLFTSPSRLPLPLLIVPFLLLFAVVFSTVIILSKGGFNRKNAARASLLAAIPLLLVVLQSLHQLTVKDLLITAGLTVVASYYLSKVDFL